MLDVTYWYRRPHEAVAQSNEDTCLFSPHRAGPDRIVCSSSPLDSGSTHSRAPTPLPPHPVPPRQPRENTALITARIEAQSSEHKSVVPCSVAELKLHHSRLAFS